MKNQSVSIFRFLIILLICAVQAGTAASKAEVPQIQEEQGPDTPGVTAVVVPAIVSEPPAQYINLSQPQGTGTIRTHEVPP